MGVNNDPKITQAQIEKAIGSRNPKQASKPPKPKGGK